MNARESSTGADAHAGGSDALVHLDPDHPGFRDAIYRERRNTIARIALDHQTGTTVARAPYSAAEHAVWAAVRSELVPLHQQRACTEILQLQEILPLDEHGGALRLTVARLLTPKGRDIESEGVEPDTVIEQDQRARALLRNLLRAGHVGLPTPKGPGVEDLPLQEAIRQLEKTLEATR